MKLFEILNAGEAISEILKKDIPIKVSFKLTTLYKRLSPEIESFETKRKDLIEKYGVDEPETGNKLVPKEKVPEFTALINELTSVEIDITYPKISLSELDAIEHLEGKYIYNLFPFIEEDK